LKLQDDEPLSNFAFSFNLRHYTTEICEYVALLLREGFITHSLAGRRSFTPGSPRLVPAIEAKM